ncbi:MAG: hypothetical protein IJX71_01590 [Oscillospiraceae bacterium]|nr:hypothetical protein [Oscillospiraceae bacterium]
MNEHEITLEQVTKLKEYADVSFADAKAALEASNGNLLDALLWLERNGKIPNAETAAYSTKEDAAEDKAPESTGQTGEPEEAMNWLNRAKRFLLDNRLEAYHRQSGRDFQVPIGVCIILLVIAFWMVPAILIVGFFLGWRYRMAGPDLDREEVNKAMEKINDTAEDVVADVVSGVKKNFK